MGYPVSGSHNPPNSLQSFPSPSTHSAAGSKTETAGSKTDKVKAALGKLVDAGQRTGISLTGALPFSSRGEIFNVACTPIRMIQNARLGSTEKPKNPVVHDWDQGIRDSYIDLTKDDDLRKTVVKENLGYAAYMYGGHITAPKENEKGPILLSSLKFKENIPEQDKPTIDDIKKGFKELNFEVDTKGNYYNLTTGTMFNFVYNEEKKEVAVCFMGLGGESKLDNNQGKAKKMIGKESAKGAAVDWLGGIPPSSRQAIEIGKLLKESTKGSGITPVMVGHSHGGGLAQTGAVANGIKGVVFNSRPMGAGTRRYIGQSTIAENAKHITAFSGKGDWLSGSVVVNRLAIIFERSTGIPVPRTVGTGYHLPKLHGLSNHSDFYEGLDQLNRISEGQTTKPIKKMPEVSEGPDWDAD